MHPAVQAAIDEALRDWTFSGGVGGDDERRRATRHYWTLRQRRLAPAFVYGFLTLFLLLFTLAAFDATSSVAGTVLGVLAAGTSLLFVLSVRSLRLTMDELTALAPALRLTRV